MRVSVRERECEREEKRKSGKFKASYHVLELHKGFFSVVQPVNTCVCEREWLCARSCV